MRTLLIWSGGVLALISTAGAQIASCHAGPSSMVGHTDGITVQRVSFAEADGKVGASVFIPASKEGRIPNVVISHSLITGKNARADMLRFAWALARAGAATIILDGTFASPLSTDDSERVRRLMACAGQWLQQKTKAEPYQTTAIAPDTFWSGWSGNEEPWSPSAGVEFPQDSSKTESITANDFRGSADFLRGWLKLNEVKSEWLADVVEAVPAKK
ncbi:MAG TPA: hypothetical protein VEG68_11680 [Terriglobales bacterium]|nr:hypothetical protein [Terriglobales bacterium]